MNESFYVIISVMFVLVAVVLVLVCIPLIRGSVAMNKTYGVRLAKAFESDANWYTLNKFGGKQIVLCSVGVMSAGILFVSMRPALGTWTFWVIILAPLWLLLLALWRIRSFAARLP